MVLQETVAALNFAGTDEQKEKGKLSSNGKIIPPPPIRPF